MRAERIKVLLAEDNEDDAILIRRALGRVTFATSVVVVSNGEHVIPYINGHGEYADRDRYPFPDVVLMDHRMPRLSGLDVLFWLRTEPRFQHLPVVILTGGLVGAELEMAAGLKAACVLKTLELQATQDAIEQGILRASLLAQGENRDSLPQTGPVP